ncbi:metallophosphoesterase, partial [Candidatus Uhrbacteria bacterium]|nr:metallophosphoesterase [Candidatus Uhrbacteria bacterium]
MTMIFDILIFGFLIIGFLFFIVLIHQWRDLRKEKSHPKQQALLLIGAVLVTLAWLTVFYGSFIEPRRLLVRQETIRLGEGTRRLRLGLISDFHSGSYLPQSTVRRTINVLKNQDPKLDAVLIAGDFIARRNRSLTQLEDFAALAKETPVYGVLG